jgi:hypothetical protein
MSQENVEIVRTALDNLYAFMRGELSREALAEVLDPQVELKYGLSDSGGDQQLHSYLEQALLRSRAAPRFSSLSEDVVSG